MGKVSVLVPFVPHRAEHIVPYAAYVQWSPAHRLWQGQGTLIDPHQSLAFAAASGFRVPVGIGVALMPFRHPYDAAMQARSLAAVTGNSVVAGYGPGAAVFQEGLMGAAYASQLTAVREYVSTVRGLLHNDSYTLDGDYFRVRSGLHPLPAPPVEVGLGVLRPGMARVAGALADVAITWLTPVNYLRDVVMPALKEGAASADRPTPRVVAMMPVALARPDRDPARLALASNEGHLRLAHYQDMLRKAGIDTDPADLKAGAKALVEGQAFLYGTVEEIAEQIRAFWDAGVDEVVVNLTGVYFTEGPKAALTELDEIVRGATR
ncbi:LLM class flavin-dependent oxidoreductase [Streptomyces sp. IBSBF 2806]|uniref:LLM class flavin-dependent oxidoreductase n=1 Tax=Streptomyces sp. IBSBF 2806 TaxID=2903529 RepID=UPI002FDBFF03